MADTVASQTIFDGDKHVVMKFTNTSDGTGEVAVAKVTVSSLLPNSRTGTACTGVQIEKIFAMTDGMGVDILWEATANVLAAHIPQNVMYEMDFGAFNGLTDNGAAGKTGNILFTTTAASAQDRYTIILYMTKTFA